VDVLRVTRAAIGLAIAIGLGSAGRAGAAGTDPPAAPPPAATMRPIGPDAPQLPERIDDGAKIRMPPLVIRQDPPATDHRPAYIGAGIFLLAVLFWWNRRLRDRFDREDGIAPRPATPRRKRREREPDADADADADDLHAAARGDAGDAGDDHHDAPAAARGDGPESSP
jgi:hypothetical protein